MFCRIPTYFPKRSTKERSEKDWENGRKIEIEKPEGGGEESIREESGERENAGNAAEAAESGEFISIVKGKREGVW